MYLCIYSNSGAATCVSSTTPIVAGQWYHVAATYDAHFAKIYVNGVLEGSIASTQPLEYANKPVILGRTNDPAWDGHLNGSLDEPAIYDRALGAAEIQNIFDAGSAGKCSFTCSQAPSGGVAWYRGEDNGLDAIGSNNATLQNGASYTAGKVGRAFDLDGVDGYVSIPDAPALRPESALTVEGWFKIDTLVTAPGENANHLVSKPLGPQFGDSYVMWISDTGHLRAGICDGTTTCDFVDSGFTVQVNTWYHVAMTFDDATNSLRVFVNGAQVSEITTNKSLVYDSHPLVIGADIEFETTQFFNDGQVERGHDL